eukprot:5162657-Ditylum_brightwellii.AAC.1
MEFTSEALPKSNQLLNHNPHAVSTIMCKVIEQENSNKNNSPNINIIVSILQKMQQMSNDSTHCY